MRLPILWFVAGVIASHVCVAMQAHADAEPSPGCVQRAIIIDVYDGDTITVQPLPPTVSVRLLDCWAAEIRGNNRSADQIKAGQDAKRHLQSLLPVSSEVLLHVPTSTRLSDSLTFGRVLGYVWRDVDGDGKRDNINSLQVETGHATRTKQ